ncbi:erythroblast NAD(P)(+)--arginine ADP-ribosyltransferase-like isoform X2 [Chamaea fasciata]|uniref:erythroblast NAD(P)(+)--arginine ADP-ribosyltransferase-like isoform X2 n=1 Tax=Chamaea fasciata TaxID=190680 RepID=UPI00336A5FE8
MAPLAHTLALLAMAVATAAISVVPLDMARNSFDDQYLTCSDKMSKKFPELQGSDFLKNKEFKENWAVAMAQWQNQGSVSSPLTPDEAIALMAYTMTDMNLYEQFNDAVHEAGSSSWKYRNEFHFKSLHFLLTRALQTLRQLGDCKDVFWGVSRYQFEVNKDDEVRFGQFTLAALSETFQRLGKDTVFQVHTCHGVDIREFSMHPWKEEVLIPPFETFKVIAVSKEGNMMYIELRSTGNSSNYECEWLKGGSLPRNSPHLRGLLLATVAMALITGTL